MDTEDVAAHISKKVYTKAVIHSTISSKSFICLSYQACIFSESGAFSELLGQVWLSAQVSNVIVYGWRDAGQNCSTRASS